MKKFQGFGRSLSKAEMKKVLGGVEDPGGDSMCNVYCGTGAAGAGKCSGNCKYCADAGNGSGSGPGEDKMCQSSM